MSSALAFEFLKKASSTAFTRRWLKQIICLMIQNTLIKKLLKGRLSLTYFLFIKMNIRNIIVNQIKEHLTYASYFLIRLNTLNTSSETEHFMVGEGWGERPK